MAPALRIAAVVDDFSLGSAAREMVDRLLVGFAWNGGFRAVPKDRRVRLVAPEEAPREDIERRARDFGLERFGSIETALDGADAVLVAGRGRHAHVPSSHIEGVLSTLSRGGRAFVLGPLGPDAATAKRRLSLAEGRGLRLLAGGYPATSWRLPAVDVPARTPLREALVVTVGETGEAEFLAVETLLPLVSLRAGGETGVRAITARTGAGIWSTDPRPPDPRGLLSSALSRSSRPQGNALRDGRTEDLVGLGLVPQIAREPVFYEIEHEDGLRSIVLVLNGVCGELNFAIDTAAGDRIAAQIYHTPPPYARHLDPLAERVERFFSEGSLLWSPHRCLLGAALLGAMRSARNAAGQRTETPDLRVAFEATSSGEFGGP